MTVAEAVSAIRARAERAAQRAGRAPGEIRLVAVTKGVDAARAREAVEAGIADLGENRVQELLRKRDAIGEPEPRWHMLGSLQRNKVARLAGRVALIHSVDSVALAQAIGGAAAPATQEILLQVNTSLEPAKHGVAPEAAPEAARAIADVAGVALRGFMTIAAPGSPEAARESFALLRRVRDETAPASPSATELSMGMSGDFEVAIEEGATLVRIGTAIFGLRDPR